MEVEKAESERSFSGESTSSSSSSSGSSTEGDGEEEPVESLCALGQTIELPQELCEDYGVFREFFSMRTWQEVDEEHKDSLKQLLPTFPENDEEEKEKTLRMLFNCEPFHFTSPLNEFFSNLRQGNFRPDIAKMRKFLKKARAKQQRHRIKSYYAKLLPEVLISRERLLAVAKACPPGSIPRLPLMPPRINSKSKYKPLFLRVKQRYFEELAAIRGEVGGEESDDENYPEGPPELSNTKKKKQLTAGPSTADGNVSGTLGGIDASQPNSLECLKNVLAAHRARRQYRENHPELNTTGIALEDIKQRVALVNGAKKLMFGGQKVDTPGQKLKRGPKKDKQLKADGGKGVRKKDEVHESVENKPLLPNIKIKCEQEESDSESSSFVDPVASPRQSKRLLEPVDIKQEVDDMKYPSVTNLNYNDPNLESLIKQEPIDPSVPPLHGSKIVQHVPIKLEDLDGIDMMALPVEIADDSGEVVVNTSNEMEDTLLDADADESLTQTTHANFLSLVRALFPARAAHRASKQQLHARCAAVMKSPIAPLNIWYNLSDDWCAELDSALDFLAGERGPHPDDFVPYLQFMPDTQMYQWIGAGRDGDATLGRLCERWLRSAAPHASSSDAPPPKYPTSWIMRPPTSAEIAEFRAQERKRFSTAAKPFTYIQHGYRSVVGPVGRSGGAGLGAVGAGALVADRPRHATFAALVRDALARLPNGEGTRHDVLTMLKMSQWIAVTSDQALLSSVSAALDRLHSAKRDPVVKYDQRTSVWTYLHRHRTEEDWLKATGGRSRGGKAAAAVTLAAPPPPPPARTPLRPSPPHALDMEVASIEEVVDGSDTDVDVDDSSSPTAMPHLSSAQLLKQATQAQSSQHSPQTKPKGKLVTLAPTKGKTTVRLNQVKPQKQATLLAQVAKQASLVAQAQKQNVTPVKPASKPTPAPQQTKPSTSQVKTSTSPTQKQTNTVTQKQAGLMAQSAKQAGVITQLKQNVPKTNVVHTKQVNVVKQPQSPKQTQSAKPNPQTTVAALTPPPAQKQSVIQQAPKPEPKPAQQKPTTVPTPCKSPLIKQRPLQKQPETSQPQLISNVVNISTANISTANLLSQQQQQTVQQPVTMQAATVIPAQSQAKVAQGPRSLLIKPSAAQVTMATATTPTAQLGGQRRGLVRVLSPLAASGKSLISPRALMTQPAAVPASAAAPASASAPASIVSTPVHKKRPAPDVAAVCVAQSTPTATTVVSSVPTVVTTSITTRTVQIAGGRTVQLAANQTVHLPGGQAVQLSSGHTLQLSSLQLPTHSVRLPSGQTVQLASPQTLRAVSTVKSSSPRTQPSSPTIKPVQAGSTVQIPISSMQLAGQTVQIGGQTVQLAGQNLQLTGHTVKLPSGQTVQVASQNVLPSQSVQLPSGQTVQIAGGNMQTVQLGQNVQVPNVLSGQTVQLAGGQTVQLPSGQTLQLASGQTVQLSGQTLQLAGGQTVQLANQTKTTVRTQPAIEKTAQPIVAKLLTNAQGQMISLETSSANSNPNVTSLVPSGSAMTATPGVGARVAVTGVRVVAPGARATRPARPLLLTAAKPLHNIILQQGDGSTIRVTSTGGASTSQTIVLSNIAGQTGTTTSSASVLKLQQVNPLQHIKLAQGIKLQQGVPTATVPTSAVRSVLMDGQQLKLVGGRHVLARILRPAPPQPPPPQHPPS